MVAKDPCKELAKDIKALRGFRCVVEMDIDELRELLNENRHGKVVLKKSNILMRPKSKNNDE